MSPDPPPKILVERYLVEIAKNYNVPFEPDPEVMMVSLIIFKKITEQKLCKILMTFEMIKICDFLLLINDFIRKLMVDSNASL